MSFFRSGGGLITPPASSASASNAPTTCPACRSSSISTTAKNPDVSSYWRCGSCGEIWNAARRTDVRSGVNSWR
jgi:transposase-like protein